ncbi:LuxR C-terminal-related transcriptional regulator [Pseudonocardia broussonetiae]|uniref:HTH luxR-type domain-containing protein n=1 Tax=Pseudonocardia broussonetiae TaxID=2736640 RepID=A0A6M6JNG2_9PSEU|nr:LuxR C-terminal-related transcriptional regulator [Pseudonocardia broussonetiae]QJY47979.1 hypothetical protein HOP40_21050 [Pseudonocardia broussonetiae]
MRDADPRFAAPVATNVVVRPRLHERLTEGVAGSCVLIAAPAGWGKTLLVGSWLGGAGRGAGGTAGRDAWVSLGSRDDDLPGFWAAVVDALAPAVGERATAELRSAVAAGDLDHLPAGVAAATAAVEPSVVLVLDNLHEITALAVHESLLRLVQRPPPGLRLVVTTRRDPPWPLNRLRLAGVLTEIRAADLAFGPGEARALLDGLGIDLDDVHVGRLVGRTEGWAAGLRLAALEMQGGVDPAGFVDAFSGDDHAVAAYLLDEVIDRLAPDVLDFLVRVSILDVVSADLADAMTGGRTGASTLAELAASHLFVHAVGSGGRWYRLHRLIADVLRTRITRPRTSRDLHRRAAEWYLHHAMPLEAVRYALRGRLWPLAAEVLGVHLLPLVVRDDPQEIDTLLSAVPREVLLGHPELAAALAGVRSYHASPHDAREMAAAARAGVDSLPPRRATRLRLVLELIDIAARRADGDLTAVAAACRRIPRDPAVLAASGLAGWDLVPMLAASNAGTAEYWTGDLVEAEAHLREADDLDRSGGVLRPHLNAAAHLALLRCEQGDLVAAEDGARSVVDRATTAGWAVSVQVVAAYLTLARVALDRDDRAGTDRWLGQVAEVEAVIPEAHVRLAAAALAALRRADTGDPAGALSGLRSATADLAGRAPPALAAGLGRVEADLLRGLGDLRGAEEVLAGLRGPPTAAHAHALARLRLATGDRVAAAQVLDRFPDDDATVRGLVEGGVLRSLVAWPDEPEAALARLERALRAAAPLAVRRPFLVQASLLRDALGARIEAGSSASAFAVDLLRRMSGGGGGPPATLVEPLTAREQHVLRYLASTLSNTEIASELYLSVNTVKTHQRMVYRKLAAGGRRDAVRRAKELRLL